MKILYVQGNPADGEAMRLGLVEAMPDCALRIAVNLAQALACLDEPSHPDLVLCDLHLSDGSGFDVLARVRARGLPLAVVMIAGEGERNIEAVALKAGADGYLIKGRQDNGQLRETLMRALRGSPARQGGESRPLRVLRIGGNQDGADPIRAQLALHAPHILLESVVDCSRARQLLHDQGRASWDVLLVESRPPGEAEMALVAALREEYGSGLPIVLLSETDSEASIARFIEQGVDHCLFKHPAYLHELPATLENVFHKNALTREHALLQEREAHSRLLLDSLAEGVYGMDVEGRCTFVNAAFLRILGYADGEELIGRPMHALIHHSHADGSAYPAQACPMCRSYLRGETIERDNEVFWQQDGTPVPVEYRAYPLLRGGRVVGAVASFTDISYRKRAETRLRQATMVFEHSRDAVMLMDGDGAILAVNPAFTAITGYAEAQALGRTTEFLRSGPHDQAFYQAIRETVGQSGYWQGEVWSRRASGELYPEWCTLSAVRDDAGQVSHFVSVATDMSQIRSSQERLEYLAHHDPLTDLPNRTLARLRLEHAMERAQRNRQRLGVLCIELSNFAAINDSLGHDIGDRLLLSVAARLTDRVRKEDTLGRVGGDEFLLLLETIHDAQDAAAVARELLDVLAAPLLVGEGQDVYLVANIGICVYPDDAGSADELLRNARMSLGQALQAGPGQFRFHTAGMNDHALQDLQLEAGLRRALERNELQLHYQPKVDLRTGRVAGAEALLRWRRQDGEMVSPGRFIPAAEKSGLISPIGAWVIDEACRQMRVWRDAGLPWPRVAVNVSAHQFQAGDLDTVVAGALARHGIPPESLEVELTESILMADPEAAVRMLGRLKAVGVKLALDDFGTGYSSLAYLRRFPFDVLKVDQSFVRDMVTDPDAAGIVTAIIGLAQRMRLRVVAEGVETEAQLDYLRAQGCDLMQGFFFSRPLPAEAYAQLLRDGRGLATAQVQTPEERGLLLVDDEANILAALRRLLRGEGYRVHTAGSALEGLDILARHPVQVILSDQRMPEMTGTEFLGRVREMYPDTVRIVLSGYTDLETLIQAVNGGAIYKFLTKPWREEQLRDHIRDAFRYHEAVMKPRRAAAAAAMAQAA
ncbi:MAG TPA: EAL domain-containing protein [Thiobacillaceae bacterium]|nr:EAL domain-containing protein [Thiobacillaceae bacterium]